MNETTLNSLVGGDAKQQSHACHFMTLQTINHQTEHEM